MYSVKHEGKNSKLVYTGTSKDVILREGIYVRDRIVDLFMLRKGKITDACKAEILNRITPVAHLFHSLGWEEHGSSSPGWLDSGIINFWLKMSSVQGSNQDALLGAHHRACEDIAKRLVMTSDVDRGVLLGDDPHIDGHIAMHFLLECYPSELYSLPDYEFEE